MTDLDMYLDREDLMSPEELEEFHHDHSTELIPTFTPAMRGWFFDMHRASPEAASRRAFERRPPAIGATNGLLLEIRLHNILLPAVQQRSLFSSLRSTMLRQLVACPGASTLNELLDILQAEIDSGVPAPIPEWYKFSTVTMGPRKIGYDACARRACFQTETVDTPFARCASCKIPYYCSRACQVADWNERHKHVCKEARKFRKVETDFGKMMQRLSDLSATGQFPSDGRDFGAAIHNAKRNPAVKERRAKLRAEKKRPLGKKPDGPDPKFF